MTKPKTVCLDFDGVVHEYRQPWTTPEEIRDGATPGFFKWALSASNRFDLVICSARFSTSEAMVAAMKWMEREFAKVLDADPDIVADVDHPLWEQITTAGFSSLFRWVLQKPAAAVYIDDRAVCFDGDWEGISLAMLDAFEPWNRREDRDYGTKLAQMFCERAAGWLPKDWNISVLLIGPNDDGAVGSNIDPEVVLEQVKEWVEEYRRAKQNVH